MAVSNNGGATVLAASSKVDARAATTTAADDLKRARLAEKQLGLGAAWRAAQESFDDGRLFSARSATKLKTLNGHVLLKTA